MLSGEVQAGRRGHVAGPGPGGEVWGQAGARASRRLAGLLLCWRGQRVLVMGAWRPGGAWITTWTGVAVEMLAGEGFAGRPGREYRPGPPGAVRIVGAMDRVI